MGAPGYIGTPPGPRLHSGHLSMHWNVPRVIQAKEFTFRAVISTASLSVDLFPGGCQCPSMLWNDDILLHQESPLHSKRHWCHQVSGERLP